MICQDKVINSSSSSSSHGVRASDCEFPPAWRGDWYQSKLGEITISSTEISYKGICFEHHGDFYVMENRFIAYSSY